MDIQFRLGTVDDAGMIVGLINELAEYEKLPDKITTTEEDIRTAIANRDIETLFASSNGKEVGFAMFLDNYASIFGAKGMFIENLYVRPEYRGNGIGEAIMRELCRIAVSRGYKKVEWHCLEWNEPANQLYLKLNATQKRDWIFYRLFGETLEELGKREHWIIDQFTLKGLSHFQMRQPLSVDGYVMSFDSYFTLIFTVTVLVAALYFEFPAALTFTFSL